MVLRRGSMHADVLRRISKVLNLGKIGDSINELAWSVGQIIKQVKKSSIEQRTLVLFVNDHGPNNWGCQPSFSMGPFRGRSGTSWEGSMRGPAIAWWPGRIKPGIVTSAITSPMDIFPTVLRLVGNFPASKVLECIIILSFFHKVIQRI